VSRALIRSSGPLLLALALAVAGHAGQGRGDKTPPKPDKTKTPYEKFMEKGRLRDFPARPWNQAFARSSICYRVRTNTSMEVAEYVGVLMDAIHYHYCRLFGVSGTRKANINVFRTHKEMAAWGKKHCKYTVRASTIGFYTTRYGGTICVVWQRLKGQHPQTVLMHEGTHQFVGAVWGSRTLPIWLNEGFAVYFENSKFDGRNLDVGRIPVGRLRRLQGQMRQDKHVKLAKLFATDHKKFSVDCYGSGWALVFWLAHSAKGQRKRIHQLALQKFVGDCRRNRRDGKRLAAYLGLTMEQLEKQWKDWVLKLDPKDPYGGTRSKPKDKKDGNQEKGTSAGKPAS
jgi:hypothetical protein